MDTALRAPLLRLLTGLGTFFWMLLTLSSASAELPLEVNGLRGGRHVGSAAPLSSAPRLSVGTGYAYTEPVLTAEKELLGERESGHHRVLGELAAGYAPWSYLQLSIGFSGRYDDHGSDNGWALATTLTTRHALAISRSLSLAVQTRWAFPASASRKQGLRAVSPELGLLGSYLFSNRYELSLLAGYRFDRSRESVAASSLSLDDRLGASVSLYDAALLGALLSAPLGPLTASLEWSWDYAIAGSATTPVGADAPTAMQSPMRVRLAAQTELAERYVPGIEVGVSPSTRPSIDALVRIEPRVWLAVTLGLIFERRRAPPPAPASEPSAPAASPISEPARLTVHVIDPAGAPIAGAQIMLADRPDPLVTDEAGAITLSLSPEQPPRMTIQSEGFEPLERELAELVAAGDVTVTLTRALPEGEIKGKVRSLRGGRPIRAQIRVQPLDTVVDTAPDGQFVIAVPPGAYTLEITAEGHEPQQRQAQVERHGVTILVVDLRRAAQ